MQNELLTIYGLCFKMGAVTFGGGYAMLPILRKEIVENHKWLTEEEIMDFYAVSQGIPGIIAVNVAGFIGYARKKTIGAIAAILGMVSPCILIIMTIAAFLNNFQDNIYIAHALSAVSVCVCALIIDSLIAMWKKGVKDIFGVIVFVTMLILMIFTDLSPILLIIIAALSGIMSKSIKAGKVQ